jgi:hypothetical protein
MHLSGSSVIQQPQLKELILRNFPDLYIRDAGWHKIVFGIHSLDQKIVLKIGTRKSVENDHRAYKRVPENLRHKIFARIFWHTKYCLLQEYGFPVQVTQEELTNLRKTVYKYGIFDVKAENIKSIEGHLKIIDANATRYPAPGLLIKMDETKPKLPKRLVLFFKKVSRRFYD